MKRITVCLALAAILLVVLPVASLSKAKRALKKSDLQGWKITYLHRQLGRLEFGYCPIGVSIKTTLTNARFKQQPGHYDLGQVCIYNPDAKTYLLGTPKSFARTGNLLFKGQDLDANPSPVHGKVSSPAPIRGTVQASVPAVAAGHGWRNRLVSKVPGGKLHGLDTTLLNFDHYNPDHPERNFPDKIWVSTELTQSKKCLGIICGLTDAPHNLPGIPLKIIQTVHINPDRTQTVLEAQSIEKVTFKESDFDPPAGYKLSKNDSDMLDIGPFVH